MPYDLSYTNDKKKEIKIQVKAVSAHSKTRIIAPLNLKKIDDEIPFDSLFLISLDLDFNPDAFYINSYNKLRDRLIEKNDERDRIIGSVMKG